MSPHTVPRPGLRAREQVDTEGRRGARSRARSTGRPRRRADGGVVERRCEGPGGGTAWGETGVSVNGSSHGFPFGHLGFFLSGVHGGPVPTTLVEGPVHQGTTISRVQCVWCRGTKTGHRQRMVSNLGYSVQGTGDSVKTG